MLAVRVLCFGGLIVLQCVRSCLFIAVGGFDEMIEYPCRRWVLDKQEPGENNLSLGVEWCFPKKKKKRKKKSFRWTKSSISSTRTDGMIYAAAANIRYLEHKIAATEVVTRCEIAMNDGKRVEHAQSLRHCLCLCPQQSLIPGGVLTSVSQIVVKISRGMCSMVSVSCLMSNSINLTKRMAPWSKFFAILWHAWASMLISFSLHSFLTLDQGGMITVSFERSSKTPMRLPPRSLLFLVRQDYRGSCSLMANCYRASEV